MHRPLLYVWLLALILLIPAHPVLAQKRVRRMSLEEAIALARERSIQAQIAKQQFQVSFWDYRSFRSSYLPQLGANAQVPFDRSIVSQPYIVGNTTYYQYSKQQNINYTGNLSLSQNIGFTGGNISLNSSLARTDNLLKDRDTLFPATSYLATPVYIRYSQPIFQFNPYKWDRKIKPLKYDQAKRKYLEDIEDVNIATTNFFFGLLQAQVEKKIAHTNLINYDTLYKITQGRFQLGKIPQNQLLLYELSYLRAQLAVENAQLSLDDAIFNFKSFLRLQDQDSIILEPPVDINYFLVNPLKAIEEASGNTSTSDDFQRRLLEADMNVNLARMTGRFDASLNADVGYVQSAYTFEDAYRKSSDLEKVSLVINLPFLDWGVARGKIKMAESQRDIVKNQVEQGLIDFKQSIYREVMKFNMQKNQLEIAAKADTVAKKSYKITQDRYMIGKISDFQELYTAQTEADNSENSFFTALQNYWQRYYGLRKMTLFDFQNNTRLQFNFQDVRPH